MDKHHTEILPYQIYALILQKDFFIGKTASPRISAVYSRHRCGNVAATRGILDQEEKPSLHILEQLNCTGAEAYRHVLAWIRRFEEAGYCSINHVGIAIASETLHPPAETILAKLMQVPMDQILVRTYIQKPSDANRKPSAAQRMLKKPEKNVQMNLRLSPKDKRSFDRFCKQHHLKAREALGLLLDHVTGDDEHLRPLLQERAAYGQECERLRTRLADSQTEHLPGQEQRVLDYLYFLRTGFSDYLQQIVLMPKGEPLLACSYKRFKSESGLHPDYPETEGFLVIQAVAMLWGRNKARFIVGQGPAGEYLKLRYYPKPLYMGHLVWEYPAGTRWLLGCRRAADGAMEIAAAFPLPPRMVSQNETATPAEAERRPSLNDQIANAMKQL